MFISDFFYRSDVEWNDFITIPRAFVINEEFKDISPHAKIMYGLLIDRMKLSIKNGWVDEKGRYYLIFTIQEICSMFYLSKPIAVRILKELEGLNIVEKKRQGLNKPNLLYVKKIIFNDSKKGS